MSGPAVGLTATSKQSRAVSVTTDIRRSPEAGQEYWLILKVDQVSGTHPEYYPRRQLPAEPGDVTFALTIPDDADITRPRTARVVAVSTEVSQRFASGRPDPGDPGADFLLEAPCCAVTGEIDLPFRD